VLPPGGPGVWVSRATRDLEYVWREAGEGILSGLPRDAELRSSVGRSGLLEASSSTRRRVSDERGSHVLLEASSSTADD